MVNTVLHPYYKLNYIKMAWEGPEEQAKELTTGNQNAMNWHDEALQIVERTMQEYWNEIECNVEAGSKVKPSNAILTAEVNTLKLEYDCHCCMLVEQATCNTTMGWATEL